MHNRSRSTTKAAFALVCQALCLVLLVVSPQLAAQDGQTKNRKTSSDISTLDGGLVPSPPRRQFVVPEAADVLIMGDSIAAGWPMKMLDEAFPGQTIGKVAMTGERVEETRWKLDHIDLTPKTVVLIVGTNNLGRDPPLAISATILSLVSEIQRRWRPKIDVFAILPRGENGAFRKAERLAINETVSKGLPVAIRHIDLDDKLSCAPCAAFRPDNIHLTADGYRILTEAVK
jgi:lysophospholipase L1-like esterase